MNTRVFTQSQNVEEDDLEALIDEYGDKNHLYQISKHSKHQAISVKSDILGEIGFRIPKLPQQHLSY